MSHERDLALSARSFLRPVTSRRIPLNPDLGYWGGVTYVFRASGTASSARQTVEISPGEGGEMEFLYGFIRHDAGAARTLAVHILDPSDNELTHLIDSVAFNTGIEVPLPYGATLLSIDNAGSLPVGHSWLISGEMKFQYDFVSLLTTEAIIVSGVFRVRGRKPIITTNAPAAAGPFETFTIETDDFV